MKTEIGNYYLFFEEKDFLRIYNRYISMGYTDIQGSKYIPIIKEDDYPIVLNCDKKRKYMLHGIVKHHYDIYFSDEKFKTLYQQQLRIKKLERIENEK